MFPVSLRSGKKFARGRLGGKRPPDLLYLMSGRRIAGKTGISFKYKAAPPLVRQVPLCRVETSMLDWVSIALKGGV